MQFFFFFWNILTDFELGWTPCHRRWLTSFGPQSEGDPCGERHGEDTKEEDDHVEGLLTPVSGDGLEVEKGREKETERDAAEGADQGHKLVEIA